MPALSLVQKISAGCASSGCIATLGGGFSSPMGVAVDAVGNVYVADAGTFKVTVMTAGCATSSCVTDLGGSFSSIYSVAVDQRGNVFIADSARQTVYELNYAGAPSLSFVTTAVGSTSTDSPRTVTVTNEGNASLSILALSYPTDFPQDGSALGACTTGTLVANTSCTLPIDFKPLGTYPYSTQFLSESLSLTDNSLNFSSTTQSLSLSGTANAPGISFTSPGSTTLTQGTGGVAYGSLGSVSFMATATTNPTGLTVNFTYTGTGGTTYGPSSNPPTLVGSYTVAAVALE
jgi:hypothetical protein